VGLLLLLLLGLLPKLQPCLSQPELLEIRFLLPVVVLCLLLLLLLLLMLQ
jgi:hypothetical protein